MRRPTGARLNALMAMIHGSCLCGDFRFAIEGQIRFLKNCHCSRCRKMTGSSFATYARANAQDLRILSGASSITRFERAPGNVIAFCQRCGSLVPHPPAGSPEVEFLAGLLDDDPRTRVSFHIYVGSKAPWCELSDGLPQYEEQITPATRSNVDDRCHHHTCLTE
jgi:hypothetical protein